MYAGGALFTLGVVSTGSILKDFTVNEAVPGTIFAVILAVVWPFFWLVCFLHVNRKPW